MEESKTKLTKELVKEQYFRSFFHRRGLDVIQAVVILFLAALQIWLMRDVPFNVVTFLAYIIPSPLYIFGLILAFDLCITSFKIKTGRFFITTDKIVVRLESTIRSSFPDRFVFERFGLFFLYKVYQPHKNKTVSSTRQLNEAYMNDVYYVAVINKTKRIIAVFNPKYYFTD